MNKALNEYLFTFMSKIKRFSSGSYPKLFSGDKVAKTQNQRRELCHFLPIYPYLLQLRLQKRN